MEKMEAFEQLHRQSVALLTETAPQFQFRQMDARLLVKESERKEKEEGEWISAETLLECLEEAMESEQKLIRERPGQEMIILRTAGERMRSLKDQVDNCKQTLIELRREYETASDRTVSLHEACDRLMAEHTQLAASAEHLRANLHYFRQADILLKKMTSSNLSVNGQSFIQLLGSIDECLTFLRARPDFRETSLFIAKYEQCLSKALTSIRVSVQSELNACAMAVRDRRLQLQATGTEEETFALLYGVFATRAHAVRAAFASVSERFSRVAEYQSITGDCHNSYFSIRDQLLRPVVTSTVEQLTAKHIHSSCALTRNGCAFLLRLCDDEFRLYRQFFDCPLPNLFDRFIDGMCRIFYDVLRPIIVHCPHLETLAELCTILKVEMIDERCSVPIGYANQSPATDTNSPGTVTAAVERMNPREGFVQVMVDLIGDVGERIQYRTQIYAQTDIAGYEPAPGDLAYPEKLIMMKDIAATNATKQNGDVPLVSAIDLHGLWYPTVRRTVLCLSKLFRCLDAAVFQSIATDLLMKCIESLRMASARIVIGRDGQQRKALDAQLFVVKHLLILREQTSPYRAAALHGAEAIPQRDYSVDFTRMKHSAQHLLSDRQRWFALSSNNAFLDLLFQVPIEMSESINDFRRIVDVRLKEACHQLIAITADAIILELNDFLNKAEIESASPDFNIAQHSWMSATTMQNFVGQAYRKLTQIWPQSRATFQLYIAEAETEEILLSPIRRRISDVFLRAQHLTSLIYDAEQSQIAGVPAAQQISLVLNVK